MRLKEIQRTAHQAWSPAGHHPIYLALGTSAQQLDASFNTTAAIEIFEMDFADPSLEMELKGSLPTTNRYSIIHLHILMCKSCSLHQSLHRTRIVFQVLILLSTLVDDAAFLSQARAVYYCCKWCIFLNYFIWEIATIVHCKTIHTLGTFLHFCHKLWCILLAFYALNWHKVAHNFQVEWNIGCITFLFYLQANWNGSVQLFLGMS